MSSSNYVDLIMSRIEEDRSRHGNCVFSDCYGQTLLVNQHNEIIINFSALRDAFKIASANGQPAVIEMIGVLERQAEAGRKVLKQIAKCASEGSEMTFGDVDGRVR